MVLLNRISFTDLVLCSKWSLESMEPKACSKARACFNQTCSGHPDAICDVDPCTCEPFFRNPITNSRIHHCLTAKTILAFSYDQVRDSELCNTII